MSLPKLKKDTAVLRMTPLAYMKMYGLVEGCDTEIAWHGTAKKISDGIYLVEDILCFPQYASGGVTTTDTQEYNQWLFSQPLDAPILFHGHSHVRMNAFDSPRDKRYQKELVDSLGAEDFYIFMIVNKLGEQWIRIVDKKAGKDWTTRKREILFTVDGVDDFVEQALEEVRPISKMPHPAEIVEEDLDSCEDEGEDD